MNDQTKGLLITTLGVLFIVPDALFVRLIDADSLTISFWRSLISGTTVLIGLAFIHRAATPALIASTGLKGIIYSLFLGASGISFVVAISLTSVANVVFILAAMPIFAAIIGRVFLGDRIGRRMLLTISAVVVGIAIIALGSGENEHSSLLGDLIALSTAASFAGALSMVRVARPVSLVPAIPVAFLGAAAVLLPFTDIFDVVPAQWWLFALHGGFFIAISSALLSIGPRFIAPAEAALLMLLEAALAPLLVWFVLGEDPGPWALAGGAVVLGALLVSNIVALRRMARG